MPVSRIIALPTAATQNIPNSFQDVLAALQISTSAAFTSFQDASSLLLVNNLHRLIPAKAELSSSPVSETGEIKYGASETNPLSRDYARHCSSDSEPTFFTYNHQLQAEKRYLLEVALTDWRHEAIRVLHEHRKCDIQTAFQGKDHRQPDFETWWAELQRKVDKMVEEAEDMEIPDL